MTSLKRFRPHQSSFIMLHAHHPLRSINPRGVVISKDSLILQIRFLHHNRRRRLRLEAQFAVPSHILNSEQSAIGDDDHIEVAIGDEHAVRGFDDLWQDFLYGVRGEIAFAFGAAGVVGAVFGAADEDALGGAFGPGDRVGGVQGGFHVGPVEICVCACGSVDELGGKGEHVPEQRTLLVDFVDVEAGVYGEGGVVDHVEDVAVGFAGEVEVFGWLIARWGKGEIFISESGVAA